MGVFDEVKCVFLNIFISVIMLMILTCDLYISKAHKGQLHRLEDPKG